ncbi:hypothetical protein ACF1G5_01485 [Streptomyces coeruleorubidus]|uniref:hypothetical protein n=1 Tax=Streptomyces coeruleorubidus TaxID=116188 RepID=UPI0036FDB64B
MPGPTADAKALQGHAVRAEVERTTGRYAATEECPVATAGLPGRSSVDDLLSM